MMRARRRTTERVRTHSGELALYRDCTHLERARPAMGVSQLPAPSQQSTSSDSSLAVCWVCWCWWGMFYALAISLALRVSAIDQSIGRVFSELPSRNHPLLHAPARFFRTALYLHPPLIRQLLRLLRSIPLQAVLLIANTAHGRLAEIASLASCARRASCRERCAQASVAVEA